jgi:hypothetical protein
VLDRHRLEVAISNGSLGMLADDVVVAALHYLAGTMLSNRDREVLARAVDVLKAVTELDGRQVVTGPTLRTMAPLNALDETFEAVTSASASADLSGAITGYIETVNSILASNATPANVMELKELFERLAQLTLARSEEMVRPSRDERHEWIKKALNS